MTVLLLITLVVVLPACFAFAAKAVHVSATRRWDVGARIVYREEQISTRPVAHAHNVQPAERGEFYYYSLINYLRVTEVLRDGRLIAVTNDRRQFCFAPDDAHLRKPRLLEGVLHRARFARR